LRDSQNYIRSAEIGAGIFEMKPNLVREDLEQWLPLVGWLAQRKTLHIEPGTPAITSALTSAPKTATTTLEDLVPPSPPATPTLAPVAATTYELSPAAIRASLVKPEPGKDSELSFLPSLLKRVFG
jgi:hypothetical protein